MIHRLITLYVLTCFLFCTANVFAIAKRPLEIVDVIQHVPNPSEGSEPWIIGDIEYITDSETEIETQRAAVVGNLAIITFETIDNSRLAKTIEPLEISVSKVNDGPYIFIDSNDSLSIITIQNGSVQKKRYSSEHGSWKIPTSIPSVGTIEIESIEEPIPPATFTMPPCLLAISDLEGNLDHLLQFLQFHSVIDGQFDWSWGTNHLLFNGDSVDRGNQVTELLWFMRKLQHQAFSAGGRVHVVIGNHEAMILAGDIRYTHPTYKYVAAESDIPYFQLFGENTILGNWLRAQNSIVQVGSYIFVHAGYGPELDALQLSMTDINSSVRETLGPPAWPEREDLQTSLAWHSKGPLWYRGYFTKHRNKYGPKPTDVELDAILKRHQAKTIVVGHTITGNVGWLDGDKRLIGIDVHWSTMGEGQGLLICSDAINRVTMTETNLPLAIIPTE